MHVDRLNMAEPKQASAAKKLCYFHFIDFEGSLGDRHNKNIWAGLKYAIEYDEQ